ncbi:DUF6683 family protein [Sphingosinicella sp. BN140058]|uniref:DUF6683 family protein n=1 Tax=Sphingosinicella sp. BN140058 TaxID=1892855 RepID=UPI0010103AD6|nr:DUF6683 family protein [Sphingosinicella sp. BN140058]QAY77968.1 hypothetical protein ETR14_16630 [Sphingosinicella sp. BN140058]
MRIWLAAALLWGVPAAAQDGAWFGPGYFNNWAFNQQADAMLRRSHKTIFNESVEASLRRGGASSRAPRTQVAPTNPSDVRQVADELAAGFPAAERRKAATLFADLFARYGELERRLGVQRGDPAGATAALIAASYMAHADAEVSDAGFRALYGQMRKLAPDAATAREQQGPITMAILATYLAATREALKQSPDAARAAALHEAGGRYLRALLGVDPDRVRIGDGGLAIS